MYIVSVSHLVKILPDRLAEARFSPPGKLAHHQRRLAGLSLLLQTHQTCLIASKDRRRGNRTCSLGDEGLTH